MIWYDMIWYDMIWYDMIWYDIIWYDMIWYDMIWYDMIWYFNPSKNLHFTFIRMDCDDAIFSFLFSYFVFCSGDVIRHLPLFLLTYFTFVGSFHRQDFWIDFSPRKIYNFQPKCKFCSAKCTIFNLNFLGASGKFDVCLLLNYCILFFRPAFSSCY